MDVTNLTTTELNDLLRQAARRLKLLRKRKPVAQVRAKVTKLIKAEGYTVADVLGTTGSGAGHSTRTRTGAKTGPDNRKSNALKGTKIAPKYRNPDNANETWSARGNKPRWLAAKLASGASLADFAI